jgi:hypothetical protein
MRLLPVPHVDSDEETLSGFGTGARASESGLFIGMLPLRAVSSALTVREDCVGSPRGPPGRRGG